MRKLSIKESITLIIKTLKRIKLGFKLNTIQKMRKISKIYHHKFNKWKKNICNLSFKLQIQRKIPLRRFLYNLSLIAKVNKRT
jgi:hypothetical protein